MLGRDRDRDRDREVALCEMVVCLGFMGGVDRGRWWRFHVKSDMQLFLPFPTGSIYANFPFTKSIDDRSLARSALTFFSTGIPTRTFD